MNTNIAVCIAGATGWAGSALARALVDVADFDLVAAVSRTHAGAALGSVIGRPGLTLEISASVGQALELGPDVLVEYTHPDVAKGHILMALRRGVHVVVGTSGLSDADYREIDAVAQEMGKGVLACGNFALGRANRLATIRESTLDVPLDEVRGPRESRGARLGGSQVHSVRLPGYVISLEAIFGLPDQRLTLRFDSGASAEPYVAGAVMAIRKVGRLTGLHRGLDSVMEF